MLDRHGKMIEAACERVYLRQEVILHDNDAVAVDEVFLSVERARKGGFNLKSMLAGLDAVFAVDDRAAAETARSGRAAHAAVMPKLSTCLKKLQSERLAAQNAVA